MQLSVSIKIWLSNYARKSFGRSFSRKYERKKDGALRSHIRYHSYPEIAGAFEADDHHHFIFPAPRQAISSTALWPPYPDFGGVDYDNAIVESNFENLTPLIDL